MELNSAAIVGYDLVKRTLDDLGHGDHETATSMAAALAPVFAMLGDPDARRGAALAVAERLDAEMRLADRLVLAAA